jgi:adenosylhomocysteine nucleosidase
MTEARIVELVDRAFDYRGYVTLRCRDGSELVGFVYDRSASHLEVFDEAATRRTRIPLAEIADIAFTGEDAARKSQEIWERRRGQLEPAGTQGDWALPAKVLVLVALAQELRSVTPALRAPRGGSVRDGSFGPALALAIGPGGDARRALAEHRPSVVVSCGFAGGLDPALSPGDLVLATAVRCAGGDALAAPESLRKVAAAALQGSPRCAQGELVCSTTVAASAGEKRALRGTGALAVDMESYPVAQAAREAGVPWLALRAIVDPVDSTLPAFTREARRSYLWPALRYGLSGPRAAAGLFRLARDARRAGSALQAALRRLVPALAATERDR